MRLIIKIRFFMTNLHLRVMCKNIYKYQGCCKKSFCLSFWFYEKVFCYQSSFTCHMHKDDRSMFNKPRVAIQKSVKCTTDGPLIANIHDIKVKVSDYSQYLMLYRLNTQHPLSSLDSFYYFHSTPRGAYSQLLPLWVATLESHMRDNAIHFYRILFISLK